MFYSMPQVGARFAVTPVSLPGTPPPPPPHDCKLLHPPTQVRAGVCSPSRGLSLDVYLPSPLLVRVACCCCCCAMRPSRLFRRVLSLIGFSVVLLLRPHPGHLWGRKHEQDSDVYCCSSLHHYAALRPSCCSAACFHVVPAFASLACARASLFLALLLTLPLTCPT